MYQLFISGYHLAHVSQGKPYHVYTIEMIDCNSGLKHVTDKRYSEFNTLHRMLKKDCHTAPFPPKRVRNSNVKVLEQRRAALEIYLQKMLRLPDTKQQILNFLGIDETSEFYSRRQSIFKDDNAGAQSSSLNQPPVLTFHCDPYIYSNKSSSLPDIVTNGVLLGVYKS